MTAQYRFLYDECLSVRLVALTHNYGFDATPVNYIDRRGESDRLLAVRAVESDTVIVTKNARDFKRIYRELDLHPGLIVILPSAKTAEQLDLMERVLVMLGGRPDGINLLIEIDIAGTITVSDWSRGRRTDP